MEESLTQRYGGDFADSRTQPGEAEKGVHQNNPYHQFSGKLMAQSFSLALETRKFSEESYEEHLALRNSEERCKNKNNNCGTQKGEQAAARMRNIIYMNFTLW